MSDKAQYSADIKAVDGDSGEFTAVVSVFGNTDLTGDVVMPGAYLDDIASWAKSEDNLPVIWSHQWQDPDYNVGVVKEMEELTPGDSRLKGAAFDLGGLLVVGGIDRGQDAGAKAGKVWKLIKGGRVNNWSFHYAVMKASMGVQDNENVRFLEKLHLTEVGPTHLGVNSLTHTVTTKAAAADALGISVGEFETLRDMIKREQATADEPVIPVEDSTHALDPRFEDGRYHRYLD